MFKSDIQSGIPREELLDLNDLNINRSNYKERCIGLHKWLISFMEYNDISLRGIAQACRIEYRSLWNFKRRRTETLCYKYALKLARYLKNQIYIHAHDEEDDLLKDIGDEHFFEG